MSNIVDTTAKETFNIDYLFPYQRLVISNILRSAGYFGEEELKESLSNQIVILPTGSGKSLCFMLPGVLLRGVTLIIFPLLSLMADQKRRIEEIGSTVITLKGGLSKEEWRENSKRIESREIKFILTNPETLQNPKVVELLAKIELSQIVVDETHTVTEWGESFRPAYLKLGDVFNKLGETVTTAFTATASKRIISGIKGYIFNNSSINIVNGNPDRINTTYNVIYCLSKTESLIELLESVEEPLIIFHQSRTSAEITNTLLSTRLQRDDIIYYHAGLTNSEKDSIENWFFYAERGILNATCAYGLGVDKPNIRTVIHLKAPTTVEAYLQETGRAGRDRKPSKAYILLYRGEDNSIISRSLQSDQCRREVLLSLLGAEVEYCSGCDVCNGTTVINELGERQIIKTLKSSFLRYNIHEFIKLLKGLHSIRNYNKQYHLSRGFGTLEKWDSDHIKEAVEQLIHHGRVKSVNFPPYRGRLFLKRTEKK